MPIAELTTPDLEKLSSEQDQPLPQSRDEGRIDHDGPSSFGQHGRAGQEVNGRLDYFGPVDYDYEPLGAVSGTYAVAVSLIFLEEISLNGGSITIL
mgnify:FL=1